MRLMKTTMFAVAAMVAAMGATGAVTTAEAKHFKKHGHVIVKPHHVKRHHHMKHWHPYYIGHGIKYGCHWSPKMQTYGMWKYGVFIPCYW